MPLGDSVSGEDNILRLGPVIVTCPACDNEQEELFEVEAIDIEQLDAAPLKEAVCEECGKAWELEFPGWAQYGYG